VLLVAAVVAFVLWRRARKHAAAETAAAAAKAQLSLDSQPPSVLTIACSRSGGERYSDAEKGLQPVHHSTPCSKREGWVVTHGITDPYVHFDANSVNNNIKFGAL
jgi:hypothetical protein